MRDYNFFTEFAKTVLANAPLVIVPMHGDKEVFERQTIDFEPAGTDARWANTTDLNWHNATRDTILVSHVGIINDIDNRLMWDMALTGRTKMVCKGDRLNLPPHSITILS